jgi:hypothetical protein
MIMIQTNVSNVVMSGEIVFSSGDGAITRYWAVH